MWFLFSEPCFLSLDSLESADFFGHKQFLGYFKLLELPRGLPRNSPLGTDNARLQASPRLCVCACTVCLMVLTGTWLLNLDVGKLVSAPARLSAGWQVTGDLVIFFCLLLCLSVWRAAVSRHCDTCHSVTRSHSSRLTGLMASRHGGLGRIPVICPVIEPNLGPLACVQQSHSTDRRSW